MNMLKLWGAIFLQKIFWIFPLNNNKVFSMSYWGKGYGDNGKYVCEELIKKFKDVKIIWPIKGKSKLGDAPENVKAVRFYSLPYFYHIATSKVWISNVRLPSYFRKRNDQYYIHMWHGSIALKYIEADTEDTLSKGYVQSAKNDSKMANLFLSNSKFWSDLIRKSFWYKGPILECGVPRLDVFYNPNIDKHAIKHKLGLKEKNILFYAPTFRADMSIDNYSIDYERLRATLTEATGENWHICVRLHPNVIGAGGELPHVDGVSDFSLYPDMYELMLVTNLLITDYSSTMFEAAFAGISVILFANDINEYNKDRKFYFDIRKLPFLLAETNDELMSAIRAFNKEKYLQKVEAFKNTLGGIIGGNASAQTADVIISQLRSNLKERKY